jgi:hypothetical protein
VLDFVTLKTQVKFLSWNLFVLSEAAHELFSIKRQLKEKTPPNSASTRR